MPSGLFDLFSCLVVEAKNSLMDRRHLDDWCSPINVRSADVDVLSFSDSGQESSVGGDSGCCEEGEFRDLGSLSTLPSWLYRTEIYLPHQCQKQALHAPRRNELPFAFIAACRARNRSAIQSHQ